MSTQSMIRGSIFPRTLIASAIFGLLTLTSVLFIPDATENTNQMFIKPQELTIKHNQTFTIDVFVSASEPVNAFNGVLEFDEKTLQVESIDYNISIANLWTQEPWFNKGEGTISFTGGSTKIGGFSGEGSLLQVTFKGSAATTTKLSLRDIRILKHDGLGTDASVANPIDALFTIEAPAKETISAAPQNTTTLSTDLNGDGDTTLADISVFMIHLTTGNLRSDFNNDKKVSTADLSILLDHRI